MAHERKSCVYLALQRTPDIPRQWLFLVAKSAIRHYCKKGKSVDGKLNKTHQRKFVWDLVNLDVVPEEVLATAAALYARSWQASPVEDMAITNVLYRELRKLLTANEDGYLSLMLQGHLCLEANALLRLTREQGREIRGRIRAKASSIFVDSEPPVMPGAIHFRKEV